jgi:sulfotransferase family protein
VSALVHCSYHKCLTVFFRRTMSPSLSSLGGYRHFNSDRTAFERERHSFRVASVNNTSLDLDELGDYRISRFVRDPRDLVVSGYFYHRKGAEPWCCEVDPDPEEWLAKRNRPIPSAVRTGESLQMALQRLDQEEGLLAEMELRARHFDSMRQWPADDPHIRVWRYEDILGDERRVMGEVATHYELPRLLRMRIERNATRFDAKHAVAEKSKHVRNPSSGQWRGVFTPRVERAFLERWGDVLERYGYGGRLADSDGQPGPARAAG